MTSRKFKLYFRGDDGKWFESAMNLEKDHSAYTLLRYANCRALRIVVNSAEDKLDMILPFYRRITKGPEVPKEETKE